MPTKERYINLFTDYGFKKKIFGEQPNKDLKYYRDLKNSIDTAFDEGRIEGREEGREQRTLEIAKEMLAEGEPVERVVRFTGLAPSIVEELSGNRQTTV